MTDSQLAVVRKMMEALRFATPFLERGEKFYKYQREGREFSPNREDAEATTREVIEALTAAKAEFPEKEGG